MAEKNASSDVLEDIKKIDKAIKAKVLIEQITNIKKLAKKMNQLRYETTCILNELDVSEKDQKRIIDYVNELPEVKLSEDDEAEIEDKAHRSVKGNKEEVEETVRGTQLPQIIERFYHSDTFGSGAGTMNLAGTSWGTSNAGVGSTYVSVPDMVYNYQSNDKGAYILSVSANGTSMSMKI